LPEALKEGLSTQESDLAEKVLSESQVHAFPFSGIVLLELLKQNPKLQQYQKTAGVFKITNANVSEDNGKKFVAVDAIKMYSELTPSDIKRILEIHKEVKTKFIQVMIDIFLNSKDHQMKTKDGDDVPIKSAFRRG